MDGDAWHGPALREVIGELTAAEAARRPLAGVHSPWEIVLHIAVWLEVVARRLQGEAVEPTPADDWPPAPDQADEAAWRTAQDRLEGAYHALVATLDDVVDPVLEGPVPGQSYTAYTMLHGAIQHTLYHAGQIALLKKAMNAPVRPADDAGAAIEEIVHRETRAWDTRDLDLLMSLFHPDMVWPWPPDARAHDPMDWVMPWGRYDESRWRAGWADLFATHDLVHNHRTIRRIEVSPQGDGAFAVVDVDTLWRDSQGRDFHWYGRACKVYTRVGDQWKLIAHTGLLEYPGMEPPDG
jgi:ketosteroid isomerase-like protein